MSKNIVIVWLAMLALQAMGAAPETQPTYSMEVGQIVEQYREDIGIEADPWHMHVAGAVYGGGACESEWHRNATSMVKNGRRADFEGLLNEESKSLRAMGLYCLVKTDGEKALPTLQKHFAEREELGVCYYGCVGETMTMGEFAANLAWNSNYLEYSTMEPKAVVPLLPKTELMRIGLQRLASDRPVKQRSQYFRRMSELVSADPSLLNMEQLRKANPDISAAAIIRTIGSLYDAGPIRPFLIKCVEDKSLDDSAMMEVARGLMRYPGHYPDARMALAKVKEAVRKKAEAKD